uniref:Uncharacterized protein n=1 Tax=Mucochytrium quahogii TaxID=96639 RepID=A0A7S2RCV2_9STRA|mmetsp:Transcript_36922/g.60060  ORF Transcript_36922/g.60060 Transcript_36922/m.60060 type:complete len:934 (+) Transcript_36922:335-3136(+)
MASGFATVKEVVSGDTLVLSGRPNNGPPPEIKLTLASLQAPRMGNKTKAGESKDEPFAFQSREFLRKLAVGKAVRFKVEYSVPSINRQFGAVYLENKENLCVTIAREGWARVKEGSETERSADLEEMKRVGEIAEQCGVGIFNKDQAGAVRNVEYDTADAQGLLAKIKGKPQRAIIEYVRDGGSFKVLLVDLQTYITFNLAGVQCPRVNAMPGSVEGPQPFGPEARYFTEMRLLNRDVHVVINGVDEKFNTFYGSVEHPAGDISVELLKNGLARSADWSMEYTTFERASNMRTAVREAKSKRLRIWRDYVAPKISGSKSFEGIVAEVVSGDTIVVRVGTSEQLSDEPWTCEEVRVSLSSIRTPRQGAKSRNEPDQPYAAEAKELLRARCLGKKCQVTIEYERQPSEGAVGLAAIPRKFGTVQVQTRKGRKNAALLLLSEGFAEVVRHRADDERSQFYDDLIATEATVKAEQKGIHSPGAEDKVVESRVLDLTTKAEQARAHLTHLQSKAAASRKAGSHKAIVEYVHNGSRLRIFLPGENCYLNFAMGGILCPQTARQGKSGKPGSAAQPFSSEALAYTRHMVLQREVIIEIESMDKGGTLIGQCFLKKGADRVNVGIQLLRQGLAYVNDFSVRFTDCGEDLIEAEAGAKQKKLRIWETYVEPVADAENTNINPAATAVAWGSSKQSEVKLPTTLVAVSEIVDGRTFFMQNQNASTKAKLASIEQEMQTLATEFGTTAGGAGSGIMEPKKGMQCIALFNDGTGNKWFRAKILNIRVEDGAELVHIRYIDYGNEETVDMGRIRAAPNAGVFQNPAIAEECTLAFLTVPALHKDYGREAAMCLSEIVYEKVVEAKIHGKDESGRHSVSLFLTEGETRCVAEILILEGLGYVDSKQTRYLKSSEENSIVKKLSASQEVAHKEHINIWRYGDPREDDA